jgi:hypothetical protein
MKTILDKVPYDTERAQQPIEVRDNSRSKIEEMRRPLLPVLKECWLAASHNPNVRIPVNVFLDTGCEITIVKPSVVDRLEKALQSQTTPFYINPTRQIKYYYHPSSVQFQNAFDLSVCLSEDCTYTSEYGFIAPIGLDFEDMDVWLGQDIFEQLIATFDGVNRNVTIVDPARD